MKVRVLLVAGALAVPLVGLVPAHAAVGCTVNGSFAPGNSIVGTAGNDVIDCSQSSDAVFVLGLGGNDRIIGSNFDDTLIGEDGSGPATGTGSAGGNDVIIGGRGNDAIGGQGGNDTLQGGDGDDTVLGGPGRDIISGGSGDDIIQAGGAVRDNIADVIDCGPGFSDQVGYSLADGDRAVSCEITNNGTTF